jgi:hypothetical protein
MFVTPSEVSRGCEIFPAMRRILTAEFDDPRGVAGYVLPHISPSVGICDIFVMVMRVNSEDEDFLTPQTVPHINLHIGWPITYCRDPLPSYIHY